MELVELFIVEYAHWVENHGFILIPDFSISEGFQNCTEPVTLRYPDGSECTAHCQFTMAHFNISDPQVPLDQHWRIVPVLQKTTEKPPKGTVVMGSIELASVLGVS